MWNFFETKVCMNLAKRTDRRKSAWMEFQRVGLSADRFECFTEDDCGGNRFLAYNKTYHEILKGSKGVTLVLEDDVIFKSWHHLEEAEKELPEDWDVLYLGANVNGTLQERFSNNLCEIRNSLTSHAVAYSDKMRRYIVDHFNPDEFPVYDEWMRVNVQEKFKCFVIKPMIAWQAPGWSDLWETQVDYRDCFIEGNKLLL
jgi:hypothetical protein